MHHPDLQCTAPIIAAATRILIAADPMHAARARPLRWQLRPDLASRLIPAQDCRLPDRPLLKAATAAWEVFLPATESWVPPSSHLMCQP